MLRPQTEETYFGGYNPAQSDNFPYPNPFVVIAITTEDNDRKGYVIVPFPIYRDAISLKADAGIVDDGALHDLDLLAAGVGWLV